MFNKQASIMIVIFNLFAVVSCTPISVEPAAVSAYPQGTPIAPVLEAYPGPNLNVPSYDVAAYNDSLTREVSIMETMVHTTIIPGTYATAQAQFATVIAENTPRPTETLEVGIFYTGVEMLLSMRPGGIDPINFWRGEINGELFLVYAGTDFFDPRVYNTPPPPSQIGLVHITRVLDGNRDGSLYRMDYETGAFEIISVSGSVLTIQSAGSTTYPPETFYFDVLTESFVEQATPTPTFTPSATPVSGATSTRQSCRPRPGNDCATPTPRGN